MRVVMRTFNRLCDSGVSGMSSSFRPLVRAVRALSGKIASRISSKMSKKLIMLLFLHGSDQETLCSVRGGSYTAYEGGSGKAHATNQGLAPLRRRQTHLERVQIQEFSRS